ncbi:MAG: hypothetical protein HYX92_21335 [Chloroflexi bacterium]|nr:hypothetical protein [Chloroflexota bacterium]
MLILGISCFYHDAAAAILRDGQLIAAAEEERFSRRKHDNGFPAGAVEFCLAQAGVTVGDLDWVVFYEKPFLKFERILMTTLQTIPRSGTVFREAMTAWLLDKLWVKGIISDRLRIDPKKVIFVEHHLSHAASSFFSSPFDKAAVLTVDGVGEWTTAALGVGEGNEIRLLKELHFPHSLGLLYSAFTAFLGFEVNEGEYKVMGMAPYGKPRYIDKVYELVKVEDDGSLWLDMDYFSFHYSSTRTFSGKFEELFGTPRLPSESGILDTYYVDIAASIQKVTEEIVLKMANHLYKETGLKKLCLAGGVALNSVSNGRILKETPFDELYIQPAAGDGGGALGAALYAYHSVLGQPRSFVMDHAYWGKGYTEEEVKKALDAQGVKYEYLGDDGKLVAQVVDALQTGKVVGWFQGRFEFGPRALGNRSILADPRRAEMKDIVNGKIKFREPFRPFAPAVLVDRAEEFYDLPQAQRHYPARFMLYVVNAKEGKRDMVPATTHEDGSSRLQTVLPEYSERYYQLIHGFGQTTGVPVLLNTSFNLRGEPIVTTPEQALSTFNRSGLDLLVLENFVVRKA